jgi:hypothetical protein
MLIAGKGGIGNSCVGSVDDPCAKRDACSRRKVCFRGVKGGRLRSVLCRLTSDAASWCGAMDTVSADPSRMLEMTTAVYVWGLVVGRGMRESSPPSPLAGNSGLPLPGSTPFSRVLADVPDVVLPLYSYASAAEATAESRLG